MRKVIDSKIMALVHQDLQTAHEKNPTASDADTLTAANAAYEAMQRKAMRENKPQAYGAMSDAKRYVNRILNPNYPW